MKVTESSNVLHEETFDIDHPEVSIATVSSDVKVTASPDGKSHVTVYGKLDSSRNLSDYVDVSSKNQSITIRVDKHNRGLRGFLNSISTKFLVVVQLPTSTELKITTISGNVDVEQTVNSIDINCISGSISVLHNPTGSCALKTISGNISTHTFSGCEYSLNSISGDIKVHIAPDLEVDVDGKSISGILESEISLNSNAQNSPANSETVVITASTISGDFTLARN
ncbi:MAG TPA: DUF4097 family beta strand repeat-containing protein [Candidatus Nanopelagicaceae bacterium]